jgi:pimeloyl-ACP methyl ester carboxylesterase
LTRLTHGKVELALEELKPGDDRPLLLLHGLGECSSTTPRALRPRLESWPGAVFGLDFTGHGGSTIPRGGGYTAEVLMGDVDVALSHLRTVTLLGRGLGAYIALLFAGARPKEVRGAILCDGPGLSGGGSRPGTPHVELVTVDRKGPAPDPFALAELSRDLRPPDYATGFVRQATHLSGLTRPITVCAARRRGVDPRRRPRVLRRCAGVRPVVGVSKGGRARVCLVPAEWGVPWTDQAGSGRSESGSCSGPR